MRDLVIAGERRVDRGPPFHHVREDAVHDQVADEDAHGRAQERIDPAPMTARPDVPALRPGRRGQLEHHLPEEEDERPDDVEAVREERAVTGVRLLLGVHAADGQDHVVGFAGQQVAAAGAPVREQPAAGRMGALDLRAVGRSGARDELGRLLHDPAEGRDVLVRAEQDPRLTRACLGREVGLPLGELVAAVVEPTRHGRRVSVPHRALQHRQGEAVDLEEDDPRRVGPRQLAGAARDALDDAVRVRIVVVRPEDHVEHDADRCRDERDAESGPERVDREIAAGHAIRCQQHERVEDEDEQQAEDEHQRQAKRRDDRRQQCVEHGNHRGRHERAPEVVHVRARHDPGRDEERRGGQDPGHDQRQRPEFRARGPPGGLGRDWRLIRRGHPLGHDLIRSRFCPLREKLGRANRHRIGGPRQYRSRRVWPAEGVDE